MSDYWLAHPEAFKGQPKRAIGDYVEQEGILVPRRFDSLKEARDSGLPVIARSEHIQEYDGVSGLFNSHMIKEFSQAVDMNDFKEIAFEREREN